MDNDFQVPSANMIGLGNLYNILMQAPTVVVISKGKDHLLWLANAIAFKLMGRGEEIIGKPLREAFPQIKGTGIIESFDRVFNNGETFSEKAVPVKLFLVGKEETHYFDITYQPYYEQGGNERVGVFATLHDVTESLEMQNKKVAEVEERLHSALETAEMGTWDYNLVTNTVIASEGQKRIFGLLPEDNFSYETFLNSIVEEDREYTDQVNQDVIQMKNNHSAYDLKYRIRRVNDGELRWVRAKGKMYADQDGKAYRFIFTTLDITKEKEAEERSRHIFETVPLSIWDKDYSALIVALDELKQQYGQGLKNYLLNNKKEVYHLMSLVKINDTNRASLKMFEAETKEQLSEGLLSVFTDETIPAFVEELIAMSSGDRHFHANFIMATLKGKRIICSTTIEFPQDGNYKSVIVSRYDISELVQSNEDLQRFVHMISHDLKEPVRKISMYASRIEEELNDQCSEMISNYLGRIKAGATRMFSMIESVLKYSKINALEEVFEKVDLNQVLKKVEVDLQSLIQQKHATIHYADLPLLEATPLMLHQVLYNLIDNSLKFSRAGVDPIVTITSDTIIRKGRTYVQIVLKDNGIGFEQKYAEEVFRSFTRLHTKDKYEGTGLGLFLCKTIVDRLGGSIAVRSEEDKGTAFEILLPIEK